MTVPEQRRALVTGASGFLGSRLVRHLSAAGWTVHALVRPSSGIAALQDTIARERIHQPDGSAASLAAVMREAEPDIVFHLATHYLAAHKPADIDPMVEANIGFGTKLLEAMAETGVRRLVNAGTAWQHFQGRDYSPVNLYAATKQAFETILQYYVEAHGVQAITLKIFDTYGEGDTRKKLFYYLKRAAAGEPLGLVEGFNRVDFVHADDVMRAFEIAAERLLAGKVTAPECYALSSGAALTLREVVALFEQAAGHTLPIQWGVRAYRDREVMDPWNTGKRLPGWEPQIPLRVGIASYLRSTDI